MKSNERFIEDILKKEKIRRTEIKAAKRRTLGICTSLALCFVIGFSALSLYDVFFAKKGFSPESADNAMSDVMEGEKFESLTDGMDSDTQDEPEDDHRGESDDFKGTNGIPSIEDANIDENYGNVDYSQSNGEESNKEDMPKNDKEDGVDCEKSYAYVYWCIAGALVVAAISMVVFVILRKKK